MDERDIADEFLKVGQKSLITQKLYELKNKGKIPYIAFEIINGEVKLAKLVMGSISYYFHRTKDKDEKSLDIKKEKCSEKECNGMHFRLPFDGFEMSIQEDYENFNS